MYRVGQILAAFRQTGGKRGFFGGFGDADFQRLREFVPYREGSVDRDIESHILRFD